MGCLNIHASLLPRWRGAAPIQRAIEAGDAQTGITLMQMDAGLDTGPMLLAQALPITADDTAATLHDRLAALGATLIVQGVPAWVQGRLAARAQPADGVSYAAKIDKAEAAIDWTLPAAADRAPCARLRPVPGRHVRPGRRHRQALAGARGRRAGPSRRMPGCAGGCLARGLRAGHGAGPAGTAAHRRPPGSGG
jgi:methionyl-tRNA formyltransferase